MSDIEKCPNLSKDSVVVSLALSGHSDIWISNLIKIVIKLNFVLSCVLKTIA